MVPAFSYIASKKDQCRFRINPLYICFHFMLKLLVFGKGKIVLRTLTISQFHNFIFGQKIIGNCKIESIVYKTLRLSETGHKTWTSIKNMILTNSPNIFYTAEGCFKTYHFEVVFVLATGASFFGGQPFVSKLSVGSGVEMRLCVSVLGKRLRQLETAEVLFLSQENFFEVARFQIFVSEGIV